MTPSGKGNSSMNIEDIRHTAKEEFGKTVRKINQSGRKDRNWRNYDEIWAD